MQLVRIIIILVRHDHCNTHKQAMCSCCDLMKNVKYGISVAESLDSTRHHKIYIRK